MSATDVISGSTLIAPSSGSPSAAEAAAHAGWCHCAGVQAPACTTIQPTIAAKHSTNGQTRRNATATTARSRSAATAHNTSNTPATKLNTDHDHGRLLAKGSGASTSAASRPTKTARITAPRSTRRAGARR